ncbi:MAG: hypothetical protein ABW000_15640 [Actinoplanes sp.]
MTALIRYHLAATVHAQRYLAPLLFYALVLTVFTVNDQGPLAGSYVVSAGALLLTMCWLTITILNLENPARRAITVVTAGGAGRVLAAETLLALLAGAVLIGVGTVFPILSGEHVVTAAEVGVGVLASAVTTCMGIAVGLVCSRSVVPRPGFSLLLALIVVIALPLTPGLPPINPMLIELSSAEPPADQLPTLAAYVALAAAVLALAFTATRYVAHRRD